MQTIVPKMAANSLRILSISEKQSKFSTNKVKERGWNVCEDLAKDGKEIGQWRLIEFGQGHCWGGVGKCYGCHCRPVRFN